MQGSRNVALVGRPNVGKSRIFNRMVGRRLAIVHDMPGVTRDLTMAEIGDGDFTLMDTGGIGCKPEMTPELIHGATEEQVDFALQAAALVLFVVDGLEGCTPTDFDLAEKLRHFGKPTLLVVNKMENRRDEDALDAFFELGLGDPLAISAEHGLGFGELFKQVHDFLGPNPEPTPEQIEARKRRRIRLCLSGRPNVGKSSLGNALLHNDRLIVSEIAGTTRDAVEHDLDFAQGEETWRFRLIDTAGLKPKRKLDSPVDYFSSLRSEDAYAGADVTLLVLDAMTGVTKHDKKLAGEILEAGTGLIIVVNKWDYAIEQYRREPVKGHDTIVEFRKAFESAIREELFFLPDSPVVFTSALTGYENERLLVEARKLDLRLEQKLSTGHVNRCLRDLLERNPPRIAGGRRFKIYYALQVGARPFRIRAFCNRKETLDDSYFRYLQSGFQREFKLSGCPVRFEFAGKPQDNPYYEKREGYDSRSRSTLAKHGVGKKRK